MTTVVTVAGGSPVAIAGSSIVIVVVMAISGGRVAIPGGGGIVAIPGAVVAGVVLGHNSDNEGEEGNEGLGIGYVGFNKVWRTGFKEVGILE